MPGQGRQGIFAPLSSCKCKMGLPQKEYLQRTGGPFHDVAGVDKPAKSRIRELLNDKRKAA